MRPEKVKDKPGKERIRKGTKDRSDLIHSEEPEGIQPYENRIICGDDKGTISSFTINSSTVLTKMGWTFGEFYMFVGTYGTYSGGTRADLFNATKARYGL